MSETAPDEHAIDAELPPLTIHSVEFWDSETEDIATNFEPFRNVKLDDMDVATLKQFTAFVWKCFLRDHELLRQVALEELAEPAAPKTRKARTPRAKAQVD
jgi:hypothetical protein